MIWGGYTVYSISKVPCVCLRIIGDTASKKDIHDSVSQQMKKAFAKHRWKVILFLHDLRLFKGP